MSMHWRSLSTAEKIAAVQSVWQTGFSAGQIASLLDGATRSAIAGLYWRYRDNLKATPLNLPTKTEGTIARVRRASRPVSTTRPVMMVEPPPEAHLCGKPLMMLHRHECRWPVNDAGPSEIHLFCGQSAPAAYCAAHSYRSVKHLKGAQS